MEGQAVASKLKHYKMKTSKTAQKRFKVTATGLVLREKGQKSHLRRHRSKRAKEMYGKQMAVFEGYTPRLKRLLPNGIADN